ncbi:alpha/beta-hydrolase [Pterulicium gracile]|uniref:Alpha/beta-hydrolase n=1 Tax=Pterulicium gracile TaxID=1884261 RepID=A0A5C3Q4N2_9AGAR|nr:alpha/beta-hydrolase [Pterula gracilis]
MRFSLTLALPLVVSGAFVPFVEPADHSHSFVQSGVAPRGRNVTINGVLTYVTLPKNKKFDKSKAVVFLTDVFGLPSIDNPLLADKFADAGFATFVPDYLNGDALPQGGNSTAWRANHTEAHTTPPLLAVISALKKKGFKKIAATGYCFGGLYVTRLVQNNTIAVGSMAHPSALSVPNDFVLAKDQSDVPVHINNAERDTGFTVALAGVTDGVMGDGQYEPGYLRTQFDAVAHGFAVRADPANPVAVAAKQGAFDETIKFFKEHL